MTIDDVRSRRGQRRTRLRRPSKVTPARWVAWQALSRTFDDAAWTDRSFGALAERFALDRRERGFAQLLAYGSVQQAKRLDHVIATLGKRPLTKLDPGVLHALRIGCYELLVLAERDDEALVAGGASAHASVSQAVELVRGVVGERAVAFTNAILRRAQVDGRSILEQLDAGGDELQATSLSMPDWLVDEMRAAHGEDGIAALRAQNEPTSTTTFRRASVPETTERDDADDLERELASRLAESGAQLVEVAWPEAAPLALAAHGSIAPASELISDGAIVVQSLASQLVVAALDPRPGERVLDLCAAPGGKTTHIAILVAPDGGRVDAVELHEHRADSVRALADRLGVGDVVRVTTGDARGIEAQLTGGFDRVLVDAPCSGTGVLAARPDARWKRTPEDVDELVSLQRELLAAAARLVRPGGTVVYSTCSILDREDEAIVADHAQLGLEPDTLPETIPSELRTAAWQLRTWPHRHGTEGFFVARMRRMEGGR